MFSTLDVRPFSTSLPLYLCFSFSPSLSTSISPLHRRGDPVSLQARARGVAGERARGPAAGRRRRQDAAAAEHLQDEGAVLRHGMREDRVTCGTCAGRRMSAASLRMHFCIFLPRITVRYTNMVNCFRYNRSCFFRIRVTCASIHFSEIRLHEGPPDARPAHVACYASSRRIHLFGCRQSRTGSDAVLASKSVSASSSSSS